MKGAVGKGLIILTHALVSLSAFCYHIDLNLIFPGCNFLQFSRNLSKVCVQMVEVVRSKKWVPPNIKGFDHCKIYPDLRWRVNKLRKCIQSINHSVRHHGLQYLARTSGLLHLSWHIVGTCKANAIPIGHMCYTHVPRLDLSHHHHHPHHHLVFIQLSILNILKTS